MFWFAYNSLYKHIFLSLNKSLVTLKICFLKKYIFIFFEKNFFEKNFFLKNTYGLVKTKANVNHGYYTYVWPAGGGGSTLYN